MYAAAVNAYRNAISARAYLCPRCFAPAFGPVPGGPAVCGRCQAPVNLRERESVFASLLPPPGANPHDPGRMMNLRAQDGRPRVPSPSLQGLLGGTAIMPGRQDEALRIWQSMRERGEAGDVTVSEDLATLTMLLCQYETNRDNIAFVKALTESALDAVVLPRHRQEQLGRLCRFALAEGNVPLGQAFFSVMNPCAAELEADTEYRMSAAVLAISERDPGRALQWLGPQKDAVPIADSVDAMASVFRAHAYEMTGNVQAAAQILRELPTPEILPLVQSRFPRLGLCASSGTAYTQTATQEGASRAASQASNVGCLFGAIFMMVGFIMLAVGSGIFISTGFDLEAPGAVGELVPAGLGSVFFTIGLVSMLRARTAAKRAAWIRTHGIALTGRIARADPTGTRINNQPVLRFVVQVQGPQGPYEASFKRLMNMMQAASMIGQTVRVRADPRNLQEIILEE